LTENNLKDSSKILRRQLETFATMKVHVVLF